MISVASDALIADESGVDEFGGWSRFVGLITIGVILFWVFGFFGLAIWCAIGLGTRRSAGRCGSGGGVCW